MSNPPPTLPVFFRVVSRSKASDWRDVADRIEYERSRGDVVIDVGGAEASEGVLAIVGRLPVGVTYSFCRY